MTYSFFKDPEPRFTLDTPTEPVPQYRFESMGDRRLDAGLDRQGLQPDGIDPGELLGELPGQCPIEPTCLPDTLDMVPSTTIYGEDTLEHISDQSEQILALAEEFGVPPEAVAGAIGSEVERRGPMDVVQDLFAAAMLDFDWAVDDLLYPVTGGDGRGTMDKVTNLLNNDLGMANIKVKTALDLARDPESPAAAKLRAKLGIENIEDVSPGEIADLLRTPEGEVLFSTAIIANGKEKMDAIMANNPNISYDSTDDHQVASLISYFKEGDQFLDRSQKNTSGACPHYVEPTTGGDEYLPNKEALQEALYGPEGAPENQCRVPEEADRTVSDGTLDLLHRNRGLIHRDAERLGVAPEELAASLDQQRAEGEQDPDLAQAQDELVGQMSEDEWLAQDLERTMGGTTEGFGQPDGPLDWKIGPGAMSVSSAQQILHTASPETVGPLLEALGVQSADEVKTTDLVKLMLSEEGAILLSATELAQWNGGKKGGVCTDDPIGQAIDLSGDEAALDALGIGAHGEDEDAPSREDKVREFQRLYGIAETGVLDPATLEQMEKAKAASISLEQLQTIAPGIDEETAKLYLPHLNRAMAYADINTFERKSAFLAQVLHESYDMTSPVESEAYARTKNYTGGVKFRGRGGMHLTHDYNYKPIGDDLGVDLEANPDLAGTPEYMFLTAASFWKLNKCNRAADGIKKAGDSSFDATSRIINRNDTKALDDRQIRHGRVWRALQPKKEDKGQS